MFWTLVWNRSLINNFLICLGKTNPVKNVAPQIKQQAIGPTHCNSSMETEGLISMFNFLKGIYNSIAGRVGPQIEAPNCT